MNEADKIIKKHKRQLAVWAVVLGVICIAPVIPLCKISSLLAYTSIILYVPIYLAINVALNNKNINPIFTRDMDPAKFHYVIHKGGMSPQHGLTDISIYIQTGSYHKAIDLCHKKMSEPNFKKLKHLYDYSLMICYYNLGEWEKALELCQSLEEFFETKAGARMKKQSYYSVATRKSFMLGDYELSKQHVKALLPTLKDELNKKTAQFHYAVACLYNGESDEAKGIFEDIVKSCPKLHIARLAQNYLHSAFAKSPQFSVSHVPTVTPHEVLYDTTADDKLTAGKRSRSMVISIVCGCLIAFLIVIIISSYLI